MCPVRGQRGCFNSLGRPQPHAFPKCQIGSLDLDGVGRSAVVVDHSYDLDQDSTCGELLVLRPRKDVTVVETPPDLASWQKAARCLANFSQVLNRVRSYYVDVAMLPMDTAHETDDW